MIQLPQTPDPCPTTGNPRANPPGNQSVTAASRRWLLLRVCAALAGLAALCSLACFEETLNSSHSLRTARTLATLDPTTTEIAFALGLGEQVVGVPRGIQWPPEATSVLKVGSASQPELRLLASAAPRYVLLPAHQTDTARLLREAGYEVVEIDTQSLGGLRLGIDTLGAVFDISGAAEGLRRRLEITLAPRPMAPGRRVAVTLERGVGQTDAVRLAPPDEWVGELLARLGATNVATEASSTNSLRLTDILALEPDEILEISNAPSSPEEALQKRDDWKRAAGPDTDLPEFHALDAEGFLVPGPRLPTFYDRLTEALRTDRELPESVSTDEASAEDVPVEDGP